MAKWGIDTSRWQGDISINNIAPEFCIIKAGGSDDGLYIDSQFLNTYTKCKSAGIPCGLYWYTKSVSVTNLVAEINYLLDKIKGLQFELPLFLDLEESCSYDIAPNLAYEWLSILPERGYYPGIYASLSWWNDTLKVIAKSMTKEQKWLAYWTSASDPGFGCGIWQNGIITKNGLQIDHNYMYSDYSFIRQKGLNGYQMGNKYKDVPATRNTYKAIQNVTSAGLMNGFSDGTFRPTEPVTREQLAVVLNRLLKDIKK